MFGVKVLSYSLTQRCKLTLLVIAVDNFVQLSHIYTKICPEYISDGHLPRRCGSFNLLLHKFTFIGVWNLTLYCKNECLRGVALELVLKRGLSKHHFISPIDTKLTVFTFISHYPRGIDTKPSYLDPLHPPFIVVSMLPSDQCLW